MKNWLKKERASGFTIIEVMIVLAIAGLIMVIVFIAIPQLQRNQRDNARQNAANRIEAEMETYAGNNQGQYPIADNTALQAFRTTYLTTPQVNINNPRTGNPYTLALAAAASDDPANEDQILVFRGARCNGENAEAISGGALGGGTARTIALEVQLDRGSTKYCVDNS